MVLTITNDAPTNAVIITNPSVGHIPNMPPTCTNSAISIMGTKINISNKIGNTTHLDWI